MMTRALRSRHGGRHPRGFALVVAAAASACGSSATTSTTHHDGGASSTATGSSTRTSGETSSGATSTSGTTSTSVAAMCKDDGGSGGGGTLTGPGLHADVCVNAFLHAPRVNASTVPVLFQINSTTSTFQSPSGANSAYVFGDLGISAMRPGTYTSGATPCGTLQVTYDLANPPGLDCSSVPNPSSPTDCPKGCGTACSGFGCEPCKPQPPMVDYEAQAANFDCDGTAPPNVTGSWSVTLTSIEQFDAGSGPGYVAEYRVHGSLTATLPGSTDSGGDAGPGSAELTVTF